MLFYLRLLSWGGAFLPSLYSRSNLGLSSYNLASALLTSSCVGGRE